ncbi:MAG: DUF4169 family protein [Rhodobacteraceae bacterium]|nr:MAG: DUF4169 family protein [Paracoccaceae bacterium]
MTGSVINLRLARKRRARDAARRAADLNAAKHGESGDLRKAREAETALRTRTLDGARRDPPGEPDDA